MGTWLIQGNQLFCSNRRAQILLPLLIPVLAATIQSFWIVVIRDVHIYQALFTHYESLYHCLAVLVLIGIQEVVTACVVFPFFKFPALSRTMGLLVLAGCLYFDFVVLGRAKMR